MLICVKIATISNVRIFRFMIHFLKVTFHLLTNECRYHFPFGPTLIRVLVIRYTAKTSSEIDPKSCLYTGDLMKSILNHLYTGDLMGYPHLIHAVRNMCIIDDLSLPHSGQFWKKPISKWTVT